MNCLNFMPFAKAPTSGAANETMDGAADGVPTNYSGRWRKGFLAPILVAQIISLAACTVSAIVFMKTFDAGDLASAFPPTNDESDIVDPEAGIDVLKRAVKASLGLIFLCSLLTSIDIVLFGAKRLHPVFALVSSVFKILLAAAIVTFVPFLLLDGTLGLIFGAASAALLAASVLELIYSAIMVHRWRRARKEARKGISPVPPQTVNPAAPMQTGAPPMSAAHSAV